jgi:menaquinone-dependent protoporphyrinogen IX oxidase
MNVGIILYSHTGHTLTVGQAIMESLLAQGHKVRLERIEAANEDPNSRQPLVLTSIPDPSPYDAVILGAPVQGGRLSPIMQAYLDRLPSLREKKAACFVTQHFRAKWMGSTRAVKQITNAVEKQGATVLASGIVQWSSKDREEQIRQVADLLSRI